ncbi:hypothetical protein NQ314_014884 [Rhamnusium bicolor]|uniref:Uncharacterized protein n=1 Tax=Rhamnusium bicolor TaxID=1586634 RepID=A0AAV8X0F0_9CUCU|nr:hypothetical protein NQ314_014884 [Rhamnusium bicolor]
MERRQKCQLTESVLAPAADNYYKAHNINFSSAQEDFLNCEEDSFLQFLVGVDSETSDIIRDLIGLDDVMPLLVAIDLPNRRFAIMEYGIEITNESVNEFVTKLQRNDLKFIDITDERVEASDNNS